MGDDWVELYLVFTTGYGTAIEPYNLFDHFKAALQKAGLPDMRFYDLRHSCASILLAQNVHPRVIMEILGHSEIGATMNLYAHVVPEVQESAVQLLSQALAPKAKLARIEYERYDLEDKLIDSDIVEQEIDLALMVKLSPEDTAVAQQAFVQLKATDGDRAKAGWRKWSEVEADCYSNSCNGAGLAAQAHTGRLVVE